MADPQCRALVIGAGAGIGKATAERLQRAGYALKLADLQTKKLNEAAAQLGAEAFALDIADRAALARLARTCGPIDALVLAAGLSSSMASFTRILEVNLAGTAAALEAFVPRLRPEAAVVCIASIAGHLAGPLAPAMRAAIDRPCDPDLPGRVAAALSPREATPAAAYSLSKVGVLRLVEREARPLGSKGVRICSVSPGPIDTPMGVVEKKARPEAYAPLAFAPIPRLGETEEVANVVAFLCSRQASFMTGSDVLVDGGWMAAVRASSPNSPFALALGARSPASDD